MKINGLASPATTLPTSACHGEMSYEKKKQFGGYTKRYWRQIRRLIKREVGKVFNIKLR